MINDKADEVIKKRFKSLINRYQNNLAKSMEGGEFVFDYVHLLNCKCRKLNSHCGGPNVDSSYWIMNKK